MGRSDQRQNRRSLSMMAVFGMLAVCHLGTLWFLLLQAQVCCDKDQDKCAKAFCADVSLRLAEIRLTQLRDDTTVRQSDGQAGKKRPISSKFAKVTYDRARTSKRRWVVRTRSGGSLKVARTSA